jgi:hypothetical protein
LGALSKMAEQVAADAARTIEQAAQPLAKHDVVTIAISAVDTMLNTAQWVLGVLGVVLAVLAIVGFLYISKGAKKHAERIANRRLDDYLQGESFATLVESKLSESIEKRWQNTVVLHSIQTPDRSQGDEQPFPQKPGTAQ